MKTIILILFSLNLCCGQSDTANIELLPDKFSDTIAMEQLHLYNSDPNKKDTVKVIMLVSDTTSTLYKYNIQPTNQVNWIYGYVIKSDPEYGNVNNSNLSYYQHGIIYYKKREFQSLDFKPLNPNLIIWDYKQAK